MENMITLEREKLALEKKVANDNKELKSEEIEVKRIIAHKKPTTSKS